MRKKEEKSGTNEHNYSNFLPISVPVFGNPSIIIHLFCLPFLQFNFLLNDKSKN
jgi:hypothetical protein